MVISHRAPAQCKFFTSHQSRVTSREIQLYFSRGRKGSGDLPGLQSRRFGPSRVEWWIRLPHASANFHTYARTRNAVSAASCRVTDGPHNSRKILLVLGRKNATACCFCEGLKVVRPAPFCRADEVFGRRRRTRKRRLRLDSRFLSPPSEMIIMARRLFAACSRASEIPR